MAGQRIRVEHAHPLVYRVVGAAAAPLLAALTYHAWCAASAFFLAFTYRPAVAARPPTDLFCAFNGLAMVLLVALPLAAITWLAVWWALGRSATTVEPDVRWVVRWWGLLVPMYARACRFKDVDFVEVTAQRAGWDKADYAVAVRYGPEHKLRLVVEDELRDRTAALDLGRAVAAAVGRPLRDTSGGQL
ncbi:MAG: hypothetical protein HYU66_07300 [Armatimonadetes bacterium]|nr:hypothetical protein [Armatimonadota bacterium]